MKHFFLSTTLALSLGCGAAFAQQTAQPAPDAQNAPGQTQTQTTPAPEGYGHRHAPNPHRQAEHLSRKLNLTPDQTAKIEPILASRDQQVEALHGNAQLTPQDRHQQMRSINEQTQQAMSGILSADQMAQLKAMRHRGHHGPDHGLDHGLDQDGQPNQAPSA